MLELSLGVLLLVLLILDVMMNSRFMTTSRHARRRGLTHGRH